MHLPANSTPSDIGPYWSDEHIISSLDEYNRGGVLPNDVIADTNPFQFNPSNLPEGIWYYACSPDKKESEFGSWKVKGEASEIYKNSVISGWRTTLEFFEGKTPGKRTQWVMQEYRVVQSCPTIKNPKETRTLCTVFSCEGQSPKEKLDISDSEPTTRIISGEGSTSESQLKSTKTVLEDSTLDKALDLYVNPISDCILRGDYLELDDLLPDPVSRSSSSDNSSRQSVSSDEYFDTLALLRDLEENNQGLEEKNSNFKCISGTSAKPTEVVVLPAPSLGSVSGLKIKSPTKEIICESNSKANYPAVEVGNHIVKRHKAAGKSSTSSSTGEPLQKEGRKSGGSKKNRKKFFCFLPLLSL